MNQYPKLSADMVINQVEDGYVIYQMEKDRVHYLNHTAVLVLESCTGNNTVNDIIQIVTDVFQLSESPEKDVLDCLESMSREGIVI